MKKCFFVTGSIAVLLSSLARGGQPFSPGKTARIRADGKIIVAKMRDTVTQAITSTKTWPMQPLLPQGSIRWVVAPPKVFARNEPPMVNLRTVPQKFPAYRPFCIPVNPKNFHIAMVPVNPDIDSMGQARRLGRAWVVVPSGNPIKIIGTGKFVFMAPSTSSLPGYRGRLFPESPARVKGPGIYFPRPVFVPPKGKH